MSALGGSYMSLDIKEVIQIARAQFIELLPELSIEASDVRLEEIEQEGRNWAITFSVSNPNFKRSQLIGVRASMELARMAKIIVVDGMDGKFVGLRQRAA
jgi:hypothetical protein